MFSTYTFRKIQCIEFYLFPRFRLYKTKAVVRMSMLFLLRGMPNTGLAISYSFSLSSAEYKKEYIQGKGSGI